MIIHEGIPELNHPAGTAVTVGKFDGLHLGHQRIIAEMVREARDQGLLSVVAAIVTSGVPRIFTRDEMAEILREMGVDVFLVIPFTEEFRSTEAETFLKRDLLGKLRMKICFSGEDFRFGKSGLGDSAFLTERSRTDGFSYQMIPDLCLHGEIVKSSLIRERLAAMDVAGAAEMLGRPYTISGTVAHGRRLGSRIGFPTVNIVPPVDKFLPGFGVYQAVLTVLPGEGTDESAKDYPGILDLGVKPTVSGTGAPAAEVHLFGFDGDLYGRKVSAAFRKNIREERRFASVEALRAQIAEDVENVQQMFKE